MAVLMHFTAALTLKNVILLPLAFTWQHIQNTKVSCFPLQDIDFYGHFWYNEARRDSSSFTHLVANSFLVFQIGSGQIHTSHQFPTAPVLLLSCGFSLYLPSSYFNNTVVILQGRCKTYRILYLGDQHTLKTFLSKTSCYCATAALLQTCVTLLPVLDVLFHLRPDCRQPPAGCSRSFI